MHVEALGSGLPEILNSPKTPLCTTCEISVVTGIPPPRNTKRSPLTDALEKEAPNAVILGTAKDAPFDSLKAALIINAVLAWPELSKPFLLQRNTSEKVYSSYNKFLDWGARIVVNSTPTEGG